MKEKKGTQWENCGSYFIVERSVLLWGGETAKLHAYPGPPSERQFFLITLNFMSLVSKRCSPPPSGGKELPLSGRKLTAAL